jgi:hypothetical protein
MEFWMWCRFAARDAAKVQSERDYFLLQRDGSGRTGHVIFDKDYAGRSLGKGDAHRRALSTT